MARNEIIKKLKQNTFGLRPKFPPFKGWNDDSSENGEPQGGKK